LLSSSRSPAFKNMKFALFAAFVILGAVSTGYGLTEPKEETNQRAIDDDDQVYHPRWGLLDWFKKKYEEMKKKYDDLKKQFDDKVQGMKENICKVGIGKCFAGLKEKLKTATDEEMRGMALNATKLLMNNSQGATSLLDDLRQRVGTKNTQEMCALELGCIHSSWIQNFLLGNLSTAAVNTKFVLNTRKNPDMANPTTVWYVDMMANKRKPVFPEGTFDPRKPVKFIVHGFHGKAKDTNWPIMAKKFLEREDCNVIRVNWEHGAAGLFYLSASRNTQLVGAQIAVLMKRLVYSYDMPMDGSKFHVIGHSLGAHVAGFAGHRYEQLTEFKVDRITGLDPASPQFEDGKAKYRLDPSDADFVDVIHTDGGTIFNFLFGGFGFGMSAPCGHKDFYPNGGHEQPGCPGEKESGAQDLVEDHARCSHSRAVELFIASFDGSQGCQFQARQCESVERFEDGKCNNGEVELMGIDATRPKSSGLRKRYYLETTGEKPFCLGEDGIKTA